jgi:hypothetical protein
VQTNRTPVRNPEFSSCHAFFYRVLFRRSFSDETLRPHANLMIARFLFQKRNRAKKNTRQIEQKERDQFMDKKKEHMS